VSNYVPHYTKKLKRLRREELDLQRMAARGVELEKLLVQAEKVRDARVRALQARLATLPPRGDDFASEFGKLSARIEAAKRWTSWGILAAFGVDLPVEALLIVCAAALGWPIANVTEGR
jgi:hypothetical protein